MQMRCGVLGTTGGLLRIHLRSYYLCMKKFASTWCFDNLTAGLHRIQCLYETTILDSMLASIAVLYNSASKLILAEFLCMIYSVHVFVIVATPRMPR